jgi:hypothetical protein
VRYSYRATFGSLFSFHGGNGLVRGLCFQKFSNCDWHGPRSHINRVGPIETSDQVPAQIVQIGIEDGADLLPLFAIAKNLAMANYSDNLAALRIDDIALEHVFLFCLSDETLTTPKSAGCSGPAKARLRSPTPDPHDPPRDLPPVFRVSSTIEPCTGKGCRDAAPSHPRPS